PRRRRGHVYRRTITRRRPAPTGRSATLRRCCCRRWIRRNGCGEKPVSGREKSGGAGSSRYGWRANQGRENCRTVGGRRGNGGGADAKTTFSNDKKEGRS